MLREENCLVREVQTVLIQDFDFVLVLVLKVFLFVVNAEVQRLAVEVMMVLVRPSSGAHVGLLPDSGTSSTVAVTEVVGEILGVGDTDA